MDLIHINRFEIATKRFINNNKIFKKKKKNYPKVWRKHAPVHNGGVFMISSKGRGDWPNKR